MQPITHVYDGRLSANNRQLRAIQLVRAVREQLGDRRTDDHVLFQLVLQEEDGQLIIEFTDQLLVERVIAQPGTSYMHHLMTRSEHGASQSSLTDELEFVLDYTIDGEAVAPWSLGEVAARLGLAGMTRLTETFIALPHAVLV